MKPHRILKIIDSINLNIGKTISFAILVIMFVQCMEVILRYIFNSPTTWAWDVNSMLFRGIAIIGGAYVLFYDAHVRVDLLYKRVNPKARLVFDVISYTLIILSFIVVIWKGAEMGWTAWKTKARSPTAFAPLLWPIKSTLFVAGFLVLIQSVSNLFRSIAAFKQESRKNTESG